MRLGAQTPDPRGQDQVEVWPITSHGGCFFAKVSMAMDPFFWVVISLCPGDRADLEYIPAIENQPKHFCLSFPEPLDSQPLNINPNRTFFWAFGSINKSGTLAGILQSWSCLWDSKGTDSSSGPSAWFSIFSSKSFWTKGSKREACFKNLFVPFCLCFYCVSTTKYETHCTHRLIPFGLNPTIIKRDYLFFSRWLGTQIRVSGRPVSDRPPSSFSVGFQIQPLEKRLALRRASAPWRGECWRGCGKRPWLRLVLFSGKGGQNMLKKHLKSSKIKHLERTPIVLILTIFWNYLQKTSWCSKVNCRTSGLWPPTPCGKMMRYGSSLHQFVLTQTYQRTIKLPQETTRVQISRLVDTPGLWKEELANKKVLLLFCGKGVEKEAYFMMIDMSVSEFLVLVLRLPYLRSMHIYLPFTHQMKQM